MRFFITALAAVTMNILHQGISFAQEDSLKHYFLEGTVVTATRSEMDAAKIGRSITVITENELRNSAYHTVGELLERQQGIYMVGTKQTQGSIQNVFMRGANSNHTVLLIDGMRVSDPSSVDNALDLSEISLAHIERIEIVRGVHSTLYGSSAIGGAINIITKKSETPGLNADAVVQTGYFGGGTGELSQNVFLNYTFGSGFYANGEIYHSKSNGMNTAQDTAPPQNRFGNFDHDGFRKLDITGKMGYRDKLFDLFAAYKRVDQKSDLDKGAFVDDPNYAIQFQRNMFSYGVGYRWNEPLQFNYFGEYSGTARTSINDSDIVDHLGTSDHSYFRGDYKGTLINNEIQAALKLKHAALVAGIGSYRESMTSKTFILYTDPFFSYSSTADIDTLNIHSTINNAYVHLTINGGLLYDALSQWNLGLGGRVNHHSAYGNNFTYEINPSWCIGDNTLLFASYATGFNAPSLYRLFTPETYYTSDIQRGNKNLDPEKSVSYELGLKHTGEALRFSVSLFYTQVDHYIDYVYLWDKDIPIGSLGNDFMRDDFRGDTYLNIGDQVNKGLDASASFKVNPKLYFFGNITLIHGTVNYDPSKIDASKTQGHHVQLYSNGAFLNSGTQTSKLIRRPNTGNAGCSYFIVNNLSITGFAQYTGNRRDAFYDQTLGPFGALGHTPLKSYWSFDASAKYIFDRHWIARFKIENIFNEQTTEIRGFRNRGRGLLLSLQYVL